MGCGFVVILGVDNDFCSVRRLATISTRANLTLLRRKGNSTVISAHILPASTPVIGSMVSSSFQCYVRLLMLMPRRHSPR